MSTFFLNIVNMSISASWLVLAVLMLRLVLKKAPKWIRVLLWGLVAVRLIFPFSIESVFSMIPSAETISPEIMMDPTPELHTGISSLNSVINPIVTETFAPGEIASMNPLQLWIPLSAMVWIIGIAVMLVYTAVSYILLRRKVATAIPLRKGILQSENVASPFVLGVIRPKIYLPFQMDAQSLSYVIAHEEAHIRRKDHWWKPFGFLLLTIHWFNPLMWIGYVLLCRDIELACDEKVIKEMDSENKANYTAALVACSINRRSITACPIAFGEVGVKERVKSVMNYKKPAFWIIIAAVVICIAVAVCFLTNPPGSNELKCVSYEEAAQFYQQIADDLPSMPRDEAAAAYAEAFDLIAQGSASEQDKFAQLTREVIRSSHLKFEDEEVFDIAKDYAIAHHRIAEGDWDFGVQDLTVKSLSASDAQLNFSYFGEMWYSVKMLQIGDLWFNGEFPNPYQGELGQYLLLVRFHDADPSMKFSKQYPWLKDHELRIPRLGADRKLTMHIIGNSDHGYDIYIGSDEPFRVEAESSVRTYRLAGTVSVELHFGESPISTKPASTENTTPTDPNHPPHQIIFADSSNHDFTYSRRTNIANEKAEAKREFVLGNRTLSVNYDRSFSNALATSPQENLRLLGSFDDYHSEEIDGSMRVRFRQADNELVFYSATDRCDVTGSLTQQDAKKLADAFLKERYGDRFLTEYQDCKIVQTENSLEKSITVCYTKYVCGYPTTDRVLVTYNMCGELRAFNAMTKGLFTSAQDGITAENIATAEDILLDTPYASWNIGTKTLALDANGCCYLHIMASKSSTEAIEGVELADFYIKVSD